MYYNYYLYLACYATVARNYLLPMPNYTSEELLFLLAKKDNKAFRHLYSTYYVALKNVASNYVDSDAVAEDIVQEVFIELLETTQSFENLNHLRYFLYSVLKNKCINLLRKDKVRKRYIEEAIHEKHIMSDYEEVVLEEDVYAHLMAALEKLPPRCRLVMKLSFDGLNRSEISKKLDISIETVKEHRMIGKKRLSEMLKKRFLVVFFFY